MRRKILLPMAAILGGAAIAAGSLAWMNRYEYRVVEIAPGRMLETKRDTWTGAICVAYATAWQGVPRRLGACDAGDRQLSQN